MTYIIFLSAVAILSAILTLFHTIMISRPIKRFVWLTPIILAIFLVLMIFSFLIYNNADVIDTTETVSIALMQFSTTIVFSTVSISTFLMLVSSICLSLVSQKKIQIPENNENIIRKIEKELI